MAKKNLVQGSKSPFDIGNFNLLFHKNPLPIWIYDPENLSIIEVNDTAIQKYGYSRDEFLQMKITDLFPIDFKIKESNFKTDSIINIESTHKLKNGQLIDVEIIAHEIKYNDRKSIILFALDITARKRLDKELRLEEEKYHYLAKLISDYAYAFKVLPGGVLKGEWVTESFNKVFGVTIQEIDAAGGWQTLVHPEDLQIALQHAYKVVSGNPDVCEMRWITKNGEVRWLRDYAYPVFDEKKEKVIRIYGASQDITERKIAEEKINRLNSLLLTIRNINQFIVQIKDRDELLDKVCKLFLETINFQAAFIILFDQTKNITFTTQCGLGTIFDEFVETIKSTKLPDQITKVLNETSQCIFPNNIDNLKYLKEKNEKLRWIITRIEHQNHIFGIISLLCEEDFIDEEQLCLIRETSKDLGFALYIMQEESKKLENEKILAEREERFRITIEQTKQLIYDYDYNTGKILWFGAIEEITGYSEEEFQNFDIQLWKESIHPDDREIALELLNEALKPGKSYKVSYRFRRKDNSYIWIEDNGVFVFNDHQNPFRMYGTMRDISKEKLAEKKIKLSEITYRGIINSITEAIYIQNENGVFLDVNKAAEKMYGYPRDYFIGKTPEFVSAPGKNDLTLVAKAVREAFQGKPQKFEFWGIDKNGRIFPKDVSLTPGIYFGEKVVIAVARDITERIQNEQIIRENEERFRNLVENISDVFLITDAKGKLLYFSPNFLTETGYTYEEIVGKSYIRFVAPDYRREILKFYLEHSKLGSRDVQIEFQALRKDGSLIWVDQRTRIDRDEKGNITQYRNIIRNISERKKLEQQLSQERAFFKQLFESNPSPTVITDTNNYISNVNSAFEKLFKYSFSEIHGKKLSELIIPEEYLEEAQEIQNLVHSGFNVLKQVIRKAKDGTLFNLLLSAAPIKTNDTQIGAFAIYVDITEQIKAQESIRISEDNLRNILDNVKDAIFTASADGILTSINSAFDNLTGWRREEWLGKTITDLLHPDEYNSAIVMFKNALSGKQTELKELRIRKSDGSYLISEFLISPQIKNNQIVGVLGIARDITERKKAEEQMLQVQKLESLGTLAAGIAHDFNNILGIMIGHADLIQTLVPKETIIRKNIDAIIKAGKRAADLVKQILTFARKSEVKKEPININILIKEISKMLHETFPKTIQINLDLEQNLNMVDADNIQMHQVFINICVNARDAMPKGGILTIKTRNIEGCELQKIIPHAKNQTYIKLTISDTGTGIPPESLDRIFEPFYTTKDRTKGTGMGLAVVQGIIDTHDGFIQVDSKLNEGTTFDIYLPALILAKKSEENEEYIHEMPGGNETILIVEDEELLLALLKSFLEEKNYKVLCATNGEEAYQIYKERKDEIDLVISDYGLPKFDGLELFKKLKEIKSNIKMIIASGFVDPQTKSDILQHGVKDFVNKPYQQKEILKVIRTTLDLCK